MRRLTAGLAIVLLAAGVGISATRGWQPVPVAQAAQTWAVQVGGDPQPEDGSTAIAFFPATITVGVGDTISWNFVSKEIHTVTFDAGHVPPLFVEGFHPGPGPGDFDFTGIALPLGPVGPGATYDGTTRINSGVPQEPPPDSAPFTLTFTKPGVYDYMCAVHGPAMAGTVTVLPAGAGLPETPAQASARGAGAFAGALATLHGFVDLVQPVRVPGPSGTTISTPVAGVGAPGASVLQFVPKDLTVSRGDTIVWSMPDVNELHTVTLTSGQAPPVLIDVRPQPAGPPLIVIPAIVAQPAGGHTYTGQGFVNSGFLFAGNAFALVIDAPPGTYDFLCLLHGDDYNMKGTITVQ